MMKTSLLLNTDLSSIYNNTLDYEKDNFDLNY